MKKSLSLASIGLASVVLAGSSSPAPADGPPTPGGAKPPARSVAPGNPPAPYVYPAPVKGHYEEANLGTIDLVDGIAYAATGGGTVVYVTGKPIASPVLAGSTCPMTQARALTLLRNSGFLEVKLDASGRSDYFAGGTPYGGNGREQEVGGQYWKIDGGKVMGGRLAGLVAYPGRGQFELDLPVLKPGVDEVSEGDRVQGQRMDRSRRAPTEAELIAAYTEVRRAALAKDLKAMLAAQGFDAKQIEAIRGLAGIDADLGPHADRFLDPGSPEEPTIQAGYGSIGAKGKSSKGAAFVNYYEFAPCGDKLILVSIGENPQ